MQKHNRECRFHDQNSRVNRSALVIIPVHNAFEPFDEGGNPGNLQEKGEAYQQYCGANLSEQNHREDLNAINWLAALFLPLRQRQSLWQAVSTPSG